MLLIINIVLFIILVIIVVFMLIQQLRVRKSAVKLTEKEFHDGMKHAQVIDVREKIAYKRGHLMGARNIPFTQFKEQLVSLRKDKPVYLYEEKEIFAGKAAILLKKAKFSDVYILKKGYAAWSGRIIHKK